MQRTIYIMSGAVLTASLLFGGSSQGVLAPLIPQLLSLPLLVLALPRGLDVLRREKFLAVLVLAVVLLPILHLLPLPPSIWATLPSRAPLIEVYEAAGLGLPWGSISISPPQTWRAILILLPPLALLLGALSLDVARRRALILVAIGVGLLSVPLGMLQIVGGGDSPLYFYPISNFGNAVGFFANRNHNAAFFYTLLPLAAALWATRDPKAVVPPLLILAGVGFALVIGLVSTSSRTAVLLGGLGVAAISVTLLRQPMTGLFASRRTRLAALTGVAALGVLVLGMGLLTILERLGTEGLSDRDRRAAFWQTLEVARAYLPLGSGLGTFERVYQWREAAEAVSDHVDNHAHNEYVQLLLEGGVFAALLVAASLAWLVGASRRAFAGGAPLDERLTKGAVIAVWLLALHSIWDYPLRTVAMSALLALCVACLTPAPAREEGRSRRGAGLPRRSHSGTSRRPGVAPSR